MKRILALTVGALFTPFSMLRAVEPIEFQQSGDESEMRITR